MKSKYIFITLIISSGLFFFRVPDIRLDRFTPAQFAFFLFGAGIFASYLLYLKNRWIGFIFALCSLGFLKTHLFHQAPLEPLYKTVSFGSCIFLIYYFVRQLNFKEDVLKWFLIPACLNILLVIVQRFDINYLAFLPVPGITGFLGNKGVTASYLVMTTPLFMKYFKKGLPFLILALSLTSNFAFIGGIFIINLYFWKEQHINRKKISLISILITIIFIALFREKIMGSIMIRLSTTMGVLDGIKHNPILGWGVGSFESVMVQASNENFKYLGIFLKKMGHPHNEFLLGWWNFGFMLPILIIILICDLIKKFTKDKLIPFLILIAGGLCSISCILSPPAWFLIVFSLGIYENKGEIKCQRKRK